MRDLLVTDSENALDMVHLRKNDYDSVFYTEGYRREYVKYCSALRAVQQQEERPKKEHKHSRVGREHPQGHRRVACRV